MAQQTTAVLQETHEEELIPSNLPTVLYDVSQFDAPIVRRVKGTQSKALGELMREALFTPAPTQAPDGIVAAEILDRLDQALSEWTELERARIAELRTRIEELRNKSMHL